MILDVRTPEEISLRGPSDRWPGRSPSRLSLYEWDPEKQQFPMQLLARFRRPGQRTWPSRMTRSWSCAAQAAAAPSAVNLLAKAGFTKVHNIIDGMEGDRSRIPTASSVERLKNGWKNSGPPWTYERRPPAAMIAIHQIQLAAPGLGLRNHHLPAVSTRLQGATRPVETLGCRKAHIRMATCVIGYPAEKYHADSCAQARRRDVDLKRYG